MIRGYSKNGISKLALGTHLGDFSEEDSKKYIDAISYALTNGITAIDGAINYRGMCSEKDEGIAIRILMEKGMLKREDFCIASKAGLLFGDARAGMNPKRYLTEILEPKGISLNDFHEYHGLYQTLKPAFFEVALEKTLVNLGLETLDIHYIHIPEITRSALSEEEFYDRMEELLEWYESKVREGKIRYYGIALEFMVEEADEDKWHFEIEQIQIRANKAANGKSHFKYVLFTYNLLCPYAATVPNQEVKGRKLTIIDTCKELGLSTVGSMPFAMGDGFQQYTAKELLDFALSGVDHVIVGSKNIAHIREVQEIVNNLKQS